MNHTTLIVDKSRYVTVSDHACFINLNESQLNEVRKLSDYIRIEEYNYDCALVSKCRAVHVSFGVKNEITFFNDTYDIVLVIVVGN